MLPAVRSTRRVALLLALSIAVLTWASCGGSSVDGAVGPTGGEVCLSDRRVCITVPIGALETQEVLRIAPGTDAPSGALSDGYDINAVTGRPVAFVKPAQVTFSLELVREAELPNENVLRIYTRERLDGGELGAWQPLENSFVDRVRNQVTGETRHLSPFAVLRTDRLIDGGSTVEIDAGPVDASVIVIPPFDGGRPDSGVPDAGRDAGVPDAGRDAGVPDAGAPDAGRPDAGSDAGVDAGIDAGTDAGDPDAGDDGGADAGDGG